jgi:hypothetical protein
MCACAARPIRSARSGDRERIELKPGWTRVTTRGAIEAARAYVCTGHRPTNLDFDPVAAHI